MPYKNKEDRAANAKIYNAANRDKYRAWNKTYRENNKEAIALKDKNYRLARPDLVAEKQHRRRARKANNGVFTISKKFMRNLYNSPCVSCGTSEKIEADHIIPIVKGGRHSEGNLHPLCRSCNSSKRAKLWIEFVAEKKGSQK